MLEWNKIFRTRRAACIFLVIIIAALSPVPSVKAAEFGTGIYMLGYQSSMAGYLPWSFDSPAYKCRCRTPRP